MNGTIIEVFRVEHLESLPDGLFKLLPWLNDDFFHYKERLPDLKKHSGTIMGGSPRWNLGVIVRDKKSAPHFGAESREMKQLPPEVDFIEFWLHKTFPSFFVITMDVHLTPQATQYLNDLHNKRFEPRIKHKRRVSWGNYRNLLTTVSLWSLMRNDMLAWLDNLRNRTEACVKPYLNGYFMQQTSRSGSRLPAIEVYIFKGVPDEEGSFYNWKWDSHHWWESLGFDFLVNTYKREGLLINWASEQDKTVQPAHRVVVLWERYLKSNNFEMYATEQIGVGYQTAEMLNGMLPCLVAWELLNSVQKNLESLKQAVFKSMKARFLLGPQIRLNNAIQLETILLDEISAEFNQQESWVKRTMTQEKLEDFRYIYHSRLAPRSENLVDHIIDEIEKRIEILNQQLASTKAWFSDHLVARNMRVMYWFTIAVIILTIMGIAATVISGADGFLKLLREMLAKGVGS